MVELEKAGKTRNRIYSTSGVYDFFDRFFRTSGLPARSIVIAFFLVFLIVPIIGGPSKDSAAHLESGIVFLGLIIVYYLTGAVLFRFRISLTDNRLRRSGTGVLAMIVVPISIYSIAALLTLVWESEVVSVLRVSSSIVIIVPLVLVITFLVESVIRRGIIQAGPRVPLLLVFLTILLMMYTFATIYFVNGLLVRTDLFTGSTLLPVSFWDALYYSGLIFTTLGSSDIFAVGMGKGVTLFESVSGYMVLGFLTAIFIQAIISAREGGRS
jgi:hypothetical protein